jgi:hypothetical protein
MVSAVGLEPHDPMMKNHVLALKSLPGGKSDPTTDWPLKHRHRKAIKVVRKDQITLFLLMFSIAIYVRDAGVAGSSPATPKSIRRK